jgi:TrmH family RNA methyltransferase
MIGETGENVVRAEAVTSPANPLLKDIRRAIARGARTREGYCVAETVHLLEEALGSGCAIGAVLAAEAARSTVEDRLRRRPETRLLVLADALFQSLSDTEAAQGVMALVRPPEWKLDQLFAGQALVVVLDGVQDPGNAGAIIRAAEAFGATGLVFLKGTVSPYNPKAVRASAGSVFRVRLVAGTEAVPARAALEGHGLDVYAAAPSGAMDLGQARLARGCAFVIGSEGRGVSQEWSAGATGLRIPTSRVESLNAATAAAILLYEARRQRTRV